MATTDVLVLQGDYLIKTRVNSAGASSGGSLTLDVGSQAGTNTGTVYINGNLVVRGSQTTISTTDSLVSDNEITLNAGEPTSATYGKVTKGTAGLKISRGRLGLDQDQFAAFLTWNDNASWKGTGAISTINGVWEFRVGKTGRPQYSAIKVNAIRIDEDSASTAGSGAGLSSRLNIFGSDNPTSVMSVAGTSNYASRVTDKDDIPNKEYVDQLLVGHQPDAERLLVGKSYVAIADSFADGVTSQIVAVLNGDPADPSQRFNPTVGTVALKLTPTNAVIGNIEFVGSQIRPTNGGLNLTLAAQGSGQIVLQAPLLFTNSIVPTPGTGQTGLYSGDAGGGGTGLYFKKKDTSGVVTQDEFVSRKKALVFSIIFG